MRDLQWSLALLPIKMVQTDSLFALVLFKHPPWRGRSSGLKVNLELPGVLMTAHIPIKCNTVGKNIRIFCWHFRATSIFRRRNQARRDTDEIKMPGSQNLRIHPSKLGSKRYDWEQACKQVDKHTSPQLVSTNALKGIKWIPIKHSDQIEVMTKYLDLNKKWKFEMINPIRMYFWNIQIRIKYEFGRVKLWTQNTWVIRAENMNFARDYPR